MSRSMRRGLVGLADVIAVDRFSDRFVDDDQTARSSRSCCSHLFRIDEPHKIAHRARSP
jgi:hypothetical protein